jgi:IclR family acetate operon transcriptional repressor
MPHLRHVVEELGESANLAMLDGERVLYVAHSPGWHSMRMFTEVGRRAGAHCTAVGKAMLAQLSDEEVITLLGRSGMPTLTQRTITTLSEMLTELRTVRADGFALDNGEQEEGVRCVAVALPGSPARAALSISAPSGRMTDSVVRKALPLLRHEAASLAEELDLHLAQTAPPTVLSTATVRQRSTLDSTQRSPSDCGS